MAAAKIGRHVPWAAALGAALFAAYGAWLHFESFATVGARGASAPYPNPYAVERRLDRAGAQGENPDFQKRAALELLRARPADGYAWMRLAYAESAATGVLTRDGLKAMERSYAVDPVSVDLTAWRIRFAAEHWRELTPSLQRRVAVEIEAARRYPRLFGPPETALDVATDPVLRQMLEGRSSPSGATEASDAPAREKLSGVRP